MALTTRAALQRACFLRIIGGLALAATVSACSSSAENDKKRDKGPPEVGYVIVQPQNVPIVTELPGRTSAYRVAEVRPQVSGIILRRLFTEGSLVRRGQPLYQIDSSLYRAARDQAAANLTSAQANAAAARAKAARYAPLAAAQAVAQQDYTDASAAADQARAAVAQNRAALNAAQVNLRFTTVPAPISGHIGRSLATEGALATDSQTTPLAIISVLDPIYVDIQQSANDLLKLRRMLAAKGAEPARAQVRLKLEDGSDYGYASQVQFSEVTVDPATGTVNLRASFPNPQGYLMPGMFVRASFSQASEANAFLVPQVAVTRDATGDAQVYIVGKNNTALVRTVKAERILGDAWVVTGGLAAGDKVITQGLGKLKAGSPVKPVPQQQQQRIGAPSSKPQSN
jgi:membrane fusion protein (multidrug efflux system)